MNTWWFKHWWRLFENITLINDLRLMDGFGLAKPFVMSLEFYNNNDQIVHLGIGCWSVIFHFETIIFNSNVSNCFGIHSHAFYILHSYQKKMVCPKSIIALGGYQSLIYLILERVPIHTCRIYNVITRDLFRSRPEVFSRRARRSTLEKSKSDYFLVSSIRFSSHTAE